MKKILLLILAAFYCGTISAQDFAYVAKQDGQTVYFDITELKTKPARGGVFKLIEKEENLKNVKGEDLGTVFSYGPSAEITDVQEKFAAALLKEEYSAAPGQKAVFQEGLVPVLAASLAETKTVVKEKPLFRSEPLDETLISARMVNLYGDGQTYLAALTENNKLKIYSLDGNVFTEKESISIPAAREAFFLSASDLKKTGRDQLLVAAQDKKSGSVFTLVFEAEGSSLKQSAMLPRAAAAVSTPDGVKVYAQEIFNKNGPRTGPIKELVFEKNKFKPVGKKISVGEAVVFAFTPLGPGSAATTQTGVIYHYPAEGKRMEFSSSNSFAATPKRITINSQIFRIPPPLLGAADAEGTKIVALENIPKIAVLADTFGSYKNTRLTVFRNTELNFAEEKIIELPAVATDLSETEIAGQNGVMVPLAYDIGKTVIELYKI